MPLHSRRKALTTIATCVALAPAVAACGSVNGSGDKAAAAEGSPAASDAGVPASEGVTQIVGGRSVLRIDSSVRRLLAATGVRISPVGQAKKVPGGIALPIVTGRLDVDTPSGTVQHDGGLRFSAGGHDLTATNLVLRPGKGVVTARVDGRRVPLFETALGKIDVRKPEDAIVVPTTVKLGQGIVRTLNHAAGAELLDGGLTLGHLKVNAKRD
jgi:hypothetical protein